MPYRWTAPPRNKRFACRSGYVLLNSTPAIELRWFIQQLQGSTMKPGRSAKMLLFFSIIGICAVLSIAASSATKTSGDASSWGFALTNLDRTCKPCDDFYQFAMGGWMKANTIPAEYSTWGSFAVLRDKNLSGMRTILENAANAKAAAGSNEQKIGDFYSSCMDTTAIEATGSKPLAADFAAIAAIQDRKGLDSEIARLHRQV